MSVILRNGIFYMRFAVKGVKVYETTRTSVRRDAERIEAKAKAQLIDEMMLGKHKHTKLHKAIQDFIESRRHFKSYESVKTHLRYFLAMDDRDFHRVTESALTLVINDRFAAGHKASTIAVTVGYWNSVVNLAAKRGYQTAPKLSKIKGVQKKIRFLTQEEQDKLFAALDPNLVLPGKTDKQVMQKQDNLDLCWLLLHTGARYSEISEMHWNQIDFDAGTIFVKRKKNGNDSTLFMTDKAREILTRRRTFEKGDYLFSRKVGIHTEGDWMRRACKRAGLSDANGSVTIHSLRHTAAHRWLASGMSLPEVKEMLGHKTIASTMVYINLVPHQVSRRAAAAFNAITN